jgi:beta-glucosidase
LKGFKRIQLEPGDSRSVVFDLSVDQLGFYDQDLRLITEPGVVQVLVGSSSEDIRLSGSFEILGSQKRYVPTRIFTCPVEVH